MKKLFFIYTNPRFMTALYEPVMSKAFDNRTDVKVYFVCDNSILMDSLENAVMPTPSVECRLERLIDNCIEAGADCIVVGCTVMNIAAEKISKTKSVPVFSVDTPMIRQIVEDGRKKAAVLSHALDNAQTIERRLSEKGIASDLYVVSAAADANRQNDKEKLEKVFQKQIKQLECPYDALVFGHISADCVTVEDCDVPIYRSGQLCIQEINKILDEGEKK